MTTLVFNDVAVKDNAQTMEMQEYEIMFMSF